MPDESHHSLHPSHPPTWCPVGWGTRGRIAAPGGRAALSSDRNGGWAGLNNCAGSTVRAAGAVVVDDQAHLNAKKGKRGHVMYGACPRRARLEFDRVVRAPARARQRFMNGIGLNILTHMILRIMLNLGHAK
jgi:hypothetical protein